MAHPLTARIAAADTAADLQNVVRDEYARRQRRASDPEGSFDKAGRFDLADSERCDCCNGVRTPSRAWPYSEMRHGRTRKHVANLVAKLAAEVDAERVSRLVAAAQTTAQAVEMVASR